jgi:hypothetical protein
MEPISISSLIISVKMAIAFLINKLHIKKCKSICCTSDCTSPPNSEKDFKIDDIVSIKPAGSSFNLNVIDVDDNNKHTHSTTI